MFGNKNKPQEPDTQIFTIYDSKSGVYDIPVFVRNKEVLIRDILNLFRDPRNTENKYLVNAEDYSIFKIGYFDRTAGTVQTQNLEHIANLHELRTMAGPPVKAVHESGALSLT